MSLHLITGHKGEAHVTAEDQGAFNAAVFGDIDAILSIGEKFKASAITANKVRIYDGELVMHGRHVRVGRNLYEEVDIANGTSGMNRNDMIVVRYVKDAASGVENVSLEVIKGMEVVGTAADPDVTVGDILSEGCLLHEMPLYRVRLTGINVTAVELVAEVLPTMKEYIETVKPVKYGGTGAETAADALRNLGITATADELNELPGHTHDEASAYSNGFMSAEDFTKVSCIPTLKRTCVVPDPFYRVYFKIPSEQHTDLTLAQVLNTKFYRIASGYAHEYYAPLSPTNVYYNSEGKQYEFNVAGTDEVDATDTIVALSALEGTFTIATGK